MRKRLDVIEAEKAKDAGTAVRFRPFAAWIRDSPPKPNLMYPTFRRYARKTNARDQLSNVEMATTLLTNGEAIIYNVFVGSLRKKQQLGSMHCPKAQSTTGMSCRKHSWANSA